MDRPIALVVALAQERLPLQRSLAAAQEGRVGDFPLVAGRLAGQVAILIQAGIGRDRARRALLAAAHRFPFCVAWSLGFAGGLIEALCPGDLVFPAVVLKDDGQAGQSFDAAPAQAAVRAALSAAGIWTHDGPLLTVDSPLRTPEVKRAAHQRTGAVAVDMEAVGVAEAARELNIPWVAMKAVVDAAGEALPEFLAGCTTAHGEVSWFRLLWGLASGERRRTLWRLHRASRQAARGLQRALGAAFTAWSP